MSTIILSVMLLIYCQIIYMILYFHYFGYVEGVGCKVYHNLQDNLQDLLLIASLHGQYDQNCLASIVVVLLPV